MKTVVVTVLLTASVTGCVSLFNGVEFDNPNKALVFAYVRFDDKTGAGWMHFKGSNNKGEDQNGQMLQQIGEWKTDGSCMLFVGTVSLGTYEIESLSGSRVVYSFEKKASDNLKITNNKPDAYFIGQFQMSLESEREFLKNGTFSFKKTTGCPSEKAAYQAFMKEEYYKTYVESTRWSKILARKIGKNT
jgi:hypothetical protein